MVTCRCLGGTPLSCSKESRMLHPFTVPWDVSWGLQVAVVGLGSLGEQCELIRNTTPLLFVPKTLFGVSKTCFSAA